MKTDTVNIQIISNFDDKEALSIPAIQSMISKPYSELSSTSICDIVLSCPQCKKTTSVNATKKMIDDYKAGVIKIKCGCGWTASFYFEYHHLPDVCIIADAIVQDEWWQSGA